MHCTLRMSLLNITFSCGLTNEEDNETIISHSVVMIFLLRQPKIELVLPVSVTHYWFTMSLLSNTTSKSFSHETFVNECGLSPSLIYKINCIKSTPELSIYYLILLFKPLFWPFVCIHLLYFACTEFLWRTASSLLPSLGFTGTYPSSLDNQSRAHNCPSQGSTLKPRPLTRTLGRKGYSYHYCWTGRAQTWGS